VEVVGIAIRSCFSILTQNLGLQDVSAKHISQLLTLNKKRELNEFAQTVYCKVKWIRVLRNYYRLSICESTGTMSVWGGSLHGGRQNHPQDWRKWQMLICEENSYFLWLLWSFALKFVLGSWTV